MELYDVMRTTFAAREFTGDQPIHICTSCGFVYVKRRRSAEAIAASWSEEIFGDGYTARIPAVIARLTYVAELLDQTLGLAGKRVCEIGAGEGEFLRILAEKGTGPGMLLRAHGMQFDSQGRLFVVDVDNARVNAYESSGKFLYAWGKDGLLPGELNAAHGLVVDPGGDVFLCGYYGPGGKYDPQGNFLFAFNHPEPPDGPMYFHSIGGDRWGNVYVAVRNLGDRRAPVSVLKYNNNGDYVTGWRLSSLDHDVNWVAVDSRDTAYVLFEGPSRVGVEVFRPE